MLQNKLKKYYSKSFRYLKVFDSSYYLEVDEYYQPLSIEDRENKVINEYDLMNKINSMNIHSLFQGDIGMGKTTLMKYLCYQWSLGKNLNNFENVIYLELKRLHSGIKNIVQFIEQEYQEVVIEFDMEKTLFIFDGIDEIISLECRENFYRLSQFLENCLYVSRNNSINMNRLHIDNIYKVDSFKDYEDLNEIHSIYSITNSSKKFLKYFQYFFNNKSKKELFSLILLFTTDKSLLKFSKSPLVFNILT